MQPELSQSSDAPPRSAPVLCLDDEVLVAIDVADALRDLGFEDVTTAFTVKGAREVLEAKPIAIAVLDVNLGHGETSFEIARKVAAEGGAVVFASGYNASGLPEEFRDSPLVSKPIHEKLLARALAQALARCGGA